MKNIIKKIIFFILLPFIKKTGLNGAIYLTFDDGPHLENTPKIIEILAKTEAKATFFMTGEEMDKYPEIVKSLVNSGHKIGYHSYYHHSLKKIAIKEVIADLNKGKAILSQYGVKKLLYRPPYGDLTFMSLVILALSGWKIVLWSLDSRDSFDLPEEIKVNIAPQILKDGEILLFHDDYSHTVELLPELLTSYKAYGLLCAPLSIDK